MKSMNQIPLEVHENFEDLDSKKQAYGLSKSIGANKGGNNMNAHKQ
jgi:hypothetical protein